MMIFQISGAPYFVAAVQGGSCSLFINTRINIVMFCCCCFCLLQTLLDIRVL